MKNVGLEQRRSSNRLSSGYRINSAADDAAGLAISETMRAQIRGLDQASRNTQDGQAMLQVTEGGMDEAGNILQRVRELLVQASNDTNTYNQRHMISDEINQLGIELLEMRERVEFNTNRVLASNSVAFFQVGPNSQQKITFNFALVSGAMLKAGNQVSTYAATISALTSVNGSIGGGSVISNMIDTIQAEMDNINRVRAQLGAIQNRMDHTMRSLDLSSENLSDAESRVRNADIAREMMRFTMTNVLQQAATSMLAQANQLPNNLLQLLR
jgi:flagellin